MAKNTKILKGGFDNDINFSKLEAFVKAHLRYEIGKDLTSKQVEKVAIDLYCWVQERKHKKTHLSLPRMMFGTMLVRTVIFMNHSKS